MYSKFFSAFLISVATAHGMEKSLIKLEPLEVKPESVSLYQHCLPPEMWRMIMDFLPKSGEIWYYLANYFDITSAEAKEIAEKIDKRYLKESLWFSEYKKKIEGCSLFKKTSKSNIHTSVKHALQESIYKPLDKNLWHQAIYNHDTSALPTLKANYEKILSEIQALLVNPAIVSTTKLNLLEYIRDSKDLQLIQSVRLDLKKIDWLLAYYHDTCPKRMLSYNTAYHFFVYFICAVFLFCAIYGLWVSLSKNLDKHVLKSRSEFYRKFCLMSGMCGLLALPFLLMMTIAYSISNHMKMDRFLEELQGKINLLMNHVRAKESDIKKSS